MKPGDIVKLTAYLQENRATIETNDGQESWKQLAASIGQALACSVQVATLQQVCGELGIVRARGKPSKRIAELIAEVERARGLAKRLAETPGIVIAVDLQQALKAEGIIE